MVDVRAWQPPCGLRRRDSILADRAEGVSFSRVLVRQDHDRKPLDGRPRRGGDSDVILVDLMLHRVAAQFLLLLLRTIIAKIVSGVLIGIGIGIVPKIDDRPLTSRDQRPVGHRILRRFPKMTMGITVPIEHHRPLPPFASTFMDRGIPEVLLSFHHKYRAPPAAAASKASRRERAAMGNVGSLVACFGCNRKRRRNGHDAYRYASRPLEPVQRKVRRTDEDCGSWFSEFDIDGKAEEFIGRQRRRMNEGGSCREREESVTGNTGGLGFSKAFQQAG